MSLGHVPTWRVFPWNKKSREMDGSVRMPTGPQTGGKRVKTEEVCPLNIFSQRVYLENATCSERRNWVTRQLPGAETGRVAGAGTTAAFGGRKGTVDCRWKNSDRLHDAEVGMRSPCGVRDPRSQVSSDAVVSANPAHFSPAPHFLGDTKRES